MELDRHLTDNSRSNPEVSVDLFPSKFDFYGLWSAEVSRRSCAITECAAAPFLVFFQVTGEMRGAIVVAFDREPPITPENDLSTWTELANVLAGKLASEIAERGVMDVMISPPETSIGDAHRMRYIRGALLAGGSPGSLARLYNLRGERPMSLRMAFLPSLVTGGAT